MIHVRAAVEEAISLQGGHIRARQRRWLRLPPDSHVSELLLTSPQSKRHKKSSQSRYFARRLFVCSAQALHSPSFKEQDHFPCSVSGEYFTNTNTEHYLLLLSCVRMPDMILQESHVGATVSHGSRNTCLRVPYAPSWQVSLAPSR